MRTQTFKAVLFDPHAVYGGLPEPPDACFARIHRAFIRSSGGFHFAPVYFAPWVQTGRAAAVRREEDAAWAI